MTSLALKLATTLCVTFTSVVAFVVMLGAPVFDSEGGLERTALKVVLGALLVVIGTVTIGRVWALPVAPRLPDRVLIIAALTLIPLGAATVVGTSQLALRTGDMEWYMVHAGLALIGQGFLTVLVLRPTSARVR
jgi:hypothetical protein